MPSLLFFSLSFSHFKKFRNYLTLIDHIIKNHLSIQSVPTSHQNPTYPLYIDKKKTFTHHVGSEIDAKDGYSAQRQRYVTEDEGEERRDFGNVRGKSVSDGLLEVVENQTAFLDSGYNRCEVIIQQNHVGSLFGDVRASDTHCDAYVSFL